MAPERMDMADDMDEAAAPDPIFGASPATRAPSAEREPLSLPRLAVYSVALVSAAILLCCLVATGLVLLLAYTQGRTGLEDVVTQYRFDIGFRAQIGAGILSGFYASLAAMVLLTAKLLDRRSGWRRFLAVRPIKPGHGRTLVLAILTLVYAAATTYTIVTHQPPRLVDAGPTDVVLLGILVTNLCLLAPVAEELLFRGWLYTGLRQRVPFWPSYLATTTLFVAIHWYASVSHMLKVLPLAIVLGLVREWKDSIKPTIALHAIYNITIVAITLAET